MALTRDDLVSAVAKLNELTRSQELKWTPCNFRRKQLPDSFSLFPFEAESSFEVPYEGRLLQVTRYTSQGGLLSMDPIKKYVLDIRDQEGSAIFEFPDIAGVEDLFRSIETQRLDIEGFIKKLVAG